ncbi:hypothetical protein PYW07_010784 [Mythimna separata]|uniref:Uncharacterized protein n=1 Tax=Mythimna separata TaxID=271217 RepID=A0AAD8DL47_MYTSE|nr:hypothetical protein PYW07_010784 [Mythimna separata]
MQISEMLLIYLLISTIITVNARIVINITVPFNETNVVRTIYRGSDGKVVTDAELKLFNITNDRLNEGMKETLTKVPDGIYLTDPTPHGDTFNKFHWQEMTRRLTIKNITIIDIVNEDVVLDKHEHINNTTDHIKAKRSMYRVIENRISSTWAKTGLPRDEIFTNFTIDFGNGNVSYVNKWRNESSYSVKGLIGVTKPWYILIKPGQTVVTELIASKTIVILKVVYEAQLVGSIIASYAKVYGTYHFYAPTVQNVMKAGNMTNEVVTSEFLEIRCFTNPRLKVYDKLTGAIVEPPKRKLPLMKIIRDKNTTRIIYIKKKKPKQLKKIKK